jgi:histidinol-phosphatase (PHP family)
VSKVWRIPFDYHMHSDNSCDSRTPMREMCEEAIRKGIFEIAFTEHFDEHKDDFCYGSYKPEAYFRNLEECRAEFAPQGLTIKSGVEVGEMHLYRDAVMKVLDAYPYDVVLGSLHWNRGFSIFEKSYFETRDVLTVAKPYYEELLELIECGGFNILSHLDVYKRVGFTVWNRFDVTELEDYIRPVLAACIKHGIAPEINTSALRMTVNQTHPTIEVLHWYKEMGGELLTIGSDSHNPNQLGVGLDVALQIATEAGFTRLTRFEKRQISDFVEISPMPA